MKAGPRNGNPTRPGARRFSLRARALVSSAVAAMVFTMAPVVASAATSPPPAQDTSAFCQNVSPDNPFADVPNDPNDPHYRNILCLAAARITTGTTSTTYSPANDVLRGQMATFVARALDEAVKLSTGNKPLQTLPAYDGHNQFSDVSNTDAHVANINRLAKAGIVFGDGNGHYAPGGQVLRDQMASFINRAEKFLTGTAFTTSNDYFSDDNGDAHEANINAIASVGIVQGNTSGGYAPLATVKRSSMATFLIRWLAVEHAAGDIKALPGGAPDLVGVAATDTDHNGALSQGDHIDLTFAAPVAVSSSLTLADANSTVVLTDDSPAPAGSTSASFVLDSTKKILTVAVTGPVAAAGGDGALTGASAVTAASGITDAGSDAPWSPAAEPPADVRFVFPAVPGQPGVAVTPTATADPHFSTSGSPTGVRTCTADISGGISAVDIALFPADVLSTDLVGNPVFPDADGNQAADLVVDGTGGVLKSANGADNPATPDSNYLDGVAVSAGSVAFVIDSTTEDDVVAVVFQDSNTDNKLNLTGTGSTPKRPSEVFGIGCRTHWTPDQANPGPIFTPVTVSYVDKVANLFVAGTSGTDHATYFLTSNDQNTVGSSNSPDDAAFEAAISPFDHVSGVYGGNASLPNQLKLSDDAPVPPTSPTASEKGTTIHLSWTESATPHTDYVEIQRCALDASDNCSGALDVVANVPSWITSYDDAGRTVDTKYAYAFRAVDEGDPSDYSGTFPTATARATDKPLIEQARVVTDVANADAGDVHEFVFSEPMNSSIAATGSTYRVQDGDAMPTIVDIACGSGGTACSLSSDGRTLTVTLGSVSTVQAGTTAGLDYPATVTNVSTGWKDQGGTALDLAGSPDKVLDTDTTAPTITDVRATVDGGLTGDSGTGDTHRFIFSEVMATDLTSATYKVTGQNGLTDTVSCASPNSCAWNASPVTIGGVSYQAHRVLTVTINLGSNAASYSLTITAISGLTDVAGNDVTLTGSDKTIEVAA